MCEEQFDDYMDYDYEEEAKYEKRKKEWDLGKITQLLDILDDDAKQSLRIYIEQNTDAGDWVTFGKKIPLSEYLYSCYDYLLACGGVNGFKTFAYWISECVAEGLDLGDQYDKMCSIIREWEE